MGPLAAWLVLVALQIALAFVATSDDDAVRDPDPLFSYDLAIGGTIVYAIVVGLTFAIVKSYPMDVREALGLKRFASRWIWIALGVAVTSLIVAGISEPFLHGGEEQGLDPGSWQPDRAGAFVVQPNGGRDRAAQLDRSEPAEHPGPDRHGPRNPTGVSAQGRLGADHRRLFAD